MKQEIKSSYSKFMNDIIDLGVWRRLSPAAKALYIVLLKFSNGELKPVWPSTAKLMELTGYKQKKSIIDAKKNLQENGLVVTEEGFGHMNTRYHFVETYKIQRITKIHLRGLQKYTSEDYKNTPQRITNAYPNQYKNQVHKLNKGGEEILTKINNKDIKNNSSSIMEKFSSWSKTKVPPSTFNLIKDIEIKSTSKILYIRKSTIPKTLEPVTKKFFSQNESLLVEFLDERSWKSS